MTSQKRSPPTGSSQNPDHAPVIATFEIADWHLTPPPALRPASANPEQE
ncbi:MAG: hypothetical protein M3325_08715 [Actinomycetota bacterium]|nr:hypothetical protein [Actinomycetota bacterium]